MANIFSLFGTIFIDNEEANKSIDKTTQKGESAGSKIGKAFGAIGSAAVTMGKATIEGASKIGSAVYDMAANTAAQADEIDKMSQKLGMSRETYQEWDYILSQAGVDITSMSTGLKTLTNKIDDAKNGSESAQAMFDKLGISLDDLNKMSREEVFETVIAGMQGMEDSTERAALANDLFGKSGQELTALFNASAESTEELKNKAHELGMIMSDEAVNAGVLFTDSMDTIKRTIDSIKNMLGATFLPIVQKVLDLIISKMPSIQAMFSKLSPIVEGLFDKVLPPILDLAETLLPALFDIINVILPPVQKIISTLLPVFGTVLNKIITPLTKVIQTILPVAVDLINELTPILADLIDSALSVLIDLGDTLLPIFIQLVQTVLPPLISIVKTVLPLLSNIVNVLLPVLVDLLNSVLPPVMQIVEAVLPIVVQLIESLMPTLTEIVNTILPVVVQLIQESMPLLIQIVESLLPVVLDLTKQLLPILQPLLDVILILIEPLADMVSSLFPELIDFLMTAIETVLPTLTTVLNELMSFLTEVAEVLKGYAQGLVDWFNWFIEYLVTDFTTDWVEGWSWIKQFFVDIFNSIIEFFTGIIEFWVDLFKNSLTKIKNTVSTSLNAVKQTFFNIFDNIKNKVSDIINGIKNTIKNGLSEAKNTVTDRLNNIKQAFVKIFDKIRDTVKTAIDKIKGFFNFEVHLPHIDLPHFSISPSGWELGDLLEGEIPSLGIEWYAKGGIMKKPTVFDIDEAANVARVGGEAGDEAIAPISLLLDYVRQAVRETVVQESPSRVKSGANVNVTVNIDNVTNNTEKDVDDFIDLIMIKIDQKIKRKGVVFG